MLLRVDRLQLLQSGLATADALQRGGGRRGGKFMSTASLNCVALNDTGRSDALAESVATGPS